MGGRSPEYEVSLASGKEVIKNIDKDKYDILPVVISRDGRRWQLKSAQEVLGLGDSSPLGNLSLGELKTLKEVEPQAIAEGAELVFIAMHGPFGEDGTVQGMLELVGMPYTGSGVLASAVGMNKPMFCRLMKEAGILTPDFAVLGRNEPEEKIFEQFSLPFVVKPPDQGSSIGVSIVRQKESLPRALEMVFEHSDKVMISEFIEGVEITGGILGNRPPQVLPIAEIVPKKEFFDYEAKYDPQLCEEIVPARISLQQAKAGKEIALKVYQAVGCRDFGRVDMIISGEKIYVLEINTIPGLTPASLLPKQAAAAGISYQALLDRIIGEALKR